jgi:hypothetical protein
MNKFYKQRMIVSAGIVSVFVTGSAVEAKGFAYDGVDLLPYLNG